MRSWLSLTVFAGVVIYQNVILHDYWTGFTTGVVLCAIGQQVISAWEDRTRRRLRGREDD